MLTATDWIRCLPAGRRSFAPPLLIEALAKRVNMSPSALRSHFRAVAAMSPIQYQKRLRLQEARRLLLSNATSAEAIAYEVGYASPSQFSREYARLFGQPPRRDAESVRGGRDEAMWSYNEYSLFYSAGRDVDARPSHPPCGLGYSERMASGRLSGRPFASSRQDSDLALNADRPLEALIACP